ncbi:MAG: hypothetical protein IPL05_20610 [Betaproteobacteria bacterium]|jgi:hypothetical protein|nr:hypothetical protein [Betaproteobacteria bacterium]
MPQFPESEWILQMVGQPWSKDTAKESSSAFHAKLVEFSAKLSLDERRRLVSESVWKFLTSKRAERNRPVVDLLIDSIDDINECPTLHKQTLLQMAIGGSGAVDLGVAKSLLNAGHSLDSHVEGGISPRQALEDLYVFKGDKYYKCEMLFRMAEERQGR